MMRHISRITGARQILNSACPACSRSIRVRSASTVAVNANLKAALSQALKSAAAEHINLSRLQLALKSLEIKDEVIRVAGKSPVVPLFVELLMAKVLGLDTRPSRLKLIGHLLSESQQTPSEWQDLLESEAGDGRALLIRYGIAP